MTTEFSAASLLLGILSGILLGIGLGWSICRKKYYHKIISAMRRKDAQIARFRHLFEVFYQWTQRRKESGQTAAFFLHNGINHVAIYGYGLIGRMLKQELTQNGIMVDYAIDRNAADMSGDIAVYLPTDKLPACAMIIVTAQEFVDIRKMLAPKISCPVVSILDILETIDLESAEADMEYDNDR